MELKRPLSLDEQIARLISHKMDIDDVDYALQVLSNTNYYRLTGYALQFRDEENPDDYIPGTKFEDMVKLHEFDKAFACLLKPYLDSIELYIRSKIAYIFSMAKCHNSPYDQHYDPHNFHKKKSHNHIIISSLNREKKHSKDSLFVIHHDKQYKGKMPLWVIVELISFTNLSKLYSAMYNSEQDLIADAIGTSKKTLKNHLKCLANLRNKVAHLSRLYNVVYNPPVILGHTFLQDYPEVRSNTLFAYLIAILRRLPSNDARKTLIENIIRLIKEYSDCIRLSLLGFPDNYTDILHHEIK